LVTVAPGWRVEEFTRSLTAAAPATVEAYGRDMTAFVTWAERLGLRSPGDVQRTTVRRYLAFLATRGFARRTIARRASAVRDQGRTPPVKERKWWAGTGLNRRHQDFQS